MTKENQVLNFIKNNPKFSSKEIFEGLNSEFSYPTIKRILTKLVENKLVEVSGQGKATKYTISKTYNLFYTIDIDDYFKLEIDDRKIVSNYNFSLIREVLTGVDLFTEEEYNYLSQLQKNYESKITELSNNEYKNEIERLAIDLSWKSSQIEGNTYSLLETELLLKEKQTASGKTREEATMLLNHKESIDFIVGNPDYIIPITVSKIESIHSLLVKELEIDKNIRKRRVGITGTNYQPLDNEFQIREALEDMCTLINVKNNTFEKAFLALLLLSYIQAFSDGNKRTARIISNALLISEKHCPISFRTVDSITYKKSMLLFYEQNNITAFKEIFITQFEFATSNYF